MQKKKNYNYNSINNNIYQESSGYNLFSKPENITTNFYLLSKSENITNNDFRNQKFLDNGNLENNNYKRNNYSLSNSASYVSNHSSINKENEKNNNTEVEKFE